MNNDIFILCPHCSGIIIVQQNQLNCHIFRHGIYKNDYTQIDPHMKKHDCDNLRKNNLIYGCGKPFKIVIKNNEYVAEVCDYI